MFEIAISQMMTPRWELAREVDQVARHGFDAISVWRPKVSDVGVDEAAAKIASAGLRVASVQWAGGFTGGDGRSFDDSVADALEAIEMAEGLGAATVVVHSGCRGGHTGSHARRLLGQALEVLAPSARRAGVVLAFEPMQPAAATGCSFIVRLAEAVDVIEQFDDPCVRLTLDLWHWADDPVIQELLPRLARLTASVQVADRVGPASATGDRLPAGHGRLPLEQVVGELVAHGYDGGLEFDPVGETVEILGYDGVLAETRIVAASWAASRATAVAEGVGPLSLRRPAHFRAVGSRRSQASSQTVSPG
ncbi:MAG: sugar phosphate isomerase/epimerase [Planctomycetes bacterium]|nr:sugar phosphate isomerase/epimerase [Planctomycetota bacterium]